MTKHKSASLYLHPSAFFSHLLPGFSPLLTIFVETTILTEVAYRVVKAIKWQMCPVSLL